MKIIVLGVSTLLSVGCVLPRTVMLPVQSPALVAPEVEAQWQVGEVIARAHMDTSGGGRDYTPMETQLEQRLRRTLEAQAGLGYRVSDAPYLVEVDLDVEESENVGPWASLGLGLEAGVLLAGTGVGAVAGPPGMLIGLLIATPFALLSANTPPIMDERGKYTATLTLRRADGGLVSRRHVRVVWNTEMNGYHRGEKLAKVSGASVSELEQTLLEQLREMLRAVPRPPSLGADEGPGPEVRG